MKGFTLLEVLLALLVFSLIMSLTWTVLTPAGEGFVMLQESRMQLEEQQWIGKQLRRDVNYLTQSEDKTIAPVVLSNDSRGDGAFDALQMLIRDPMYPGLTLVRYVLDEETNMLKREAKSAWSRTHVEAISWDLAKITSFDVQALDMASGWKETWGTAPPFKKPKGLRITIRDELGEMKWDLPVLVGQ
ncbi:MAG: prepilin-type N-terminal cleavage/methylation domain-containing protein [Mariprofundaceae bacterium]|nr:prepilin-type N-terminal cleavage/methylation domain-containing protein [Mariprofundaceae bacterium]